MGQKISVLGVCGGNGVLLHPFKSEEFYIVANIEPRQLFHCTNEQAWTINFGVTPFEKELPDIVNGEIDVIVGAPDCGHSSLLYISRMKTFGNPKTNKSLNMYFQAIKDYKPKVFLMENLPALLKNYPKKVFREIFSGYNLKFYEESVTYWGNSQQSRVRLVIVGTRKDVKFKCLNPVQGKKLKTTGELLKDCPQNGNFRELLEKEFCIHGGRKLNGFEAQKEWLSFGKSKRWIVKGRKFKTAPGVYRNLNAELPLTARKARVQYREDGLNLTPRELARIQGIPDSFKIAGIGIEYWINKGRVTVTKCPPYEIGKWFARIIKKQKHEFHKHKK